MYINQHGTLCDSQGYLNVCSLKQEQVKLHPKEEQLSNKQAYNILYKC